MEKLTFLPNGQWNLEKAKPQADQSYIYNLRSSDKSKSYSDSDLKNNQNDILDLYQQHKPNSIKNTINNETGKIEPHVLMHRGASKSAKVANSKDKNGFNRFQTDDTHIHFPNDSVNTMDYNHAMEYTGDGKDVDNTHSFWVPTSKLHANGASHANTFLDPNNHHIDDIRSLSNDDYNDFTMREYSSNDLDSTDEDTRNEAGKELRQQRANDFGSHHYENGHTAIMPGKYQLASKDELQHALKDKNLNLDTSTMIDQKIKGKK